MGFSSQEEAQTLEGWLGRIHPEDRPNVQARADKSIDQRKEFDVTKPTNVQDENVLTPTAFNRQLDSSF